MELKEALVLRMSFNDVCGEIRIDKNGYVCLNDLSVYYPNKSIKDWKKNKSTVEFMDLIDKDLNRENSPHLKKCLLSKRGKYNGGTYAHQDLAMEFCMWLSPEFKLTVIQAFRKGTQRKENWNIKRILASENYKLMAESVKNDHDPVRGYHYGNEAKMLNKIVFGMHQKNIRDIATESQLDDIAWLESKNSAYIDIKMSYDDRRAILTDLYLKRNQKQIN